MTISLRSRTHARDALAVAAPPAVARAPIDVVALTFTVLCISAGLAVVPPGMGLFLLRLPRAPTADVMGLRRAPDVSVDDLGLVYLNDKPMPVAPGDLAARIADLRASRPAGHALTRAADYGAPYADVARVLAVAGSEVVLLTREPRPVEGT
jgi:biopolymer transport protein ExbD